MAEPSEKLFSIARETTRGSFLLFGGDVVARLIMFAGVIFIARLLGPSDYGLYVLSFVVAYLFIPACNLGIGYALLHFPARLRSSGEGEKVPVFLGTGIFFRFCFATLVSLLCFFAADLLAAFLFQRPELGEFLRIIAPFILLQTLFFAMYDAFIGIDESEKGALMKVVSSSLKASLAPALIVLGFGVAGALTAFVLASLVACVIALALLLRRFGRRLLSFSWAGLKEMLRYGIPVYASTLLLAVMGQYQYILLAFFASTEEIGNYGAAQRLSRALALISAPLTITMVPAFSKLDPEREAKELRKMFASYVKYYSILILPISCFSIVLSYDIIRFLYGSQYTLAPAYLALLAAVYLHAGLGYGVLPAFFNGTGDTRSTFEMGVAYSLTLLGLGTYLAYAYGVLGLLIGLLLSNSVQILYGLLKAGKRGVGLDYRAELGVYSSALISSFLILLILPLSPLRTLLGGFLGSLVEIVATGLLFLFTYASLLPLLGAVRERDLRWLRLIFGSLGPVRRAVLPVLSYEERLLRRMEGRC